MTVTISHEIEVRFKNQASFELIHEESTTSRLTFIDRYTGKKKRKNINIPAGFTLDYSPPFEGGATFSKPSFTIEKPRTYFNEENLCLKGVQVEENNITLWVTSPLTLKL